MKTMSFFLLNAMSLDFKRFTGRYVAFPVGRTKSGKYLLATCAHSVVSSGAMHAVQLLYPDGTQLSTGEMHKNHIVPPQLGLDLAFIEIQLDTDMTVSRLKSDRIKSRSEISHVRNVSGREEFNGVYNITTASVSELRQRFRPLDDYSYEEIENLRTADGQIPSGSHKGLTMQSWPGVSGSPLWDTFDNIRGMVAAGNEELTEKHPEYFLCFLPAGEISKALRKFFKDDLV